MTLERMDLLRSATAVEARRGVMGIDPFRVLPSADDDAIAAFLDTPEPERRCELCGRPLVGRALKWCSDAHRKEWSRAEQLRVGLDENWLEPPDEL